MLNNLLREIDRFRSKIDATSDVLKELFPQLIVNTIGEYLLVLSNQRFTQLAEVLIRTEGNFDTFMLRFRIFTWEEETLWCELNDALFACFLNEMAEDQYVRLVNKTRLEYG